MFFDLINNISDYFSYYDWGYFLFWARLIAGVVSAGFIAAIGVIIKKLMPYNFPKSAKRDEEKNQTAPPEKIREPWQEVLKKLDSENSADWAFAIIQADAIADRILREMGLPGESMGERLKTLDLSRLRSLNDLWEAHLIRNEIAHAPEKGITKHRAKQAISLYEKVFREMGYVE